MPAHPTSRLSVTHEERATAAPCVLLDKRCLQRSQRHWKRLVPATYPLARRVASKSLADQVRHNLLKRLGLISGASWTPAPSFHRSSASLPSFMVLIVIIIIITAVGSFIFPSLDGCDTRHASDSSSRCSHRHRSRCSGSLGDRIKLRLVSHFVAAEKRLNKHPLAPRARLKQAFCWRS